MEGKQKLVFCLNISSWCDRHNFPPRSLVCLRATNWRCSLHPAAFLTASFAVTQSIGCSHPNRACHWGWPDVVQKLLSPSVGCDVNAEDLNRCTPLFFAAAVISASCSCLIWVLGPGMLVWRVSICYKLADISKTRTSPVSCMAARSMIKRRLQLQVKLIVRREGNFLIWIMKATNCWAGRVKVPCNLSLIPFA